MPIFTLPLPAAVRSLTTAWTAAWLDPSWISAVWPILLFGGGALWFGGRFKSGVDRLIERMHELEAAKARLEEQTRAACLRIDRFDVRLTATETNVTNQGRTLDRIEAKLDRLIEGRSPSLPTANPRP